MASITCEKIVLLGGGQFEPTKGGQFQTILGGQFKTTWGGQFKTTLGGQFGRHLHPEPCLTMLTRFSCSERPRSPVKDSSSLRKVDSGKKESLGLTSLQLIITRKGQKLLLISWRKMLMRASLPLRESIIRAILRK